MFQLRRRAFAALLVLAGALLALLGFAATRVSDAFGGSDINLITGTETSPRVTQNTSSVWAHGNTVVFGYFDSSGGALSPQSLCGVSTSTDGGNTFTRLPYKFNTGGTCFGDPAVFYSLRAAKWFMSNLSSRCGGSGLGIALWTSPDGINWSNGSCVAFGGSTGVESGTAWVDNNPGSPFYGRQYFAFNDFNVGGGVVKARFSTNDGVTWSNATTLSGTFRRAIKLSGSYGRDGTIFLETMDEGGGGLTGSHQNFVYRSVDGGLTWSAAISQGDPFMGPGRATCSDNSYFTCMYASPGYWRHLGGGQLGVGPDRVVHYAYAGRTATDPGNIYYVRSIDNGSTWSAPLQLNTDATTRAQWGASLSVNSVGVVFVSWYDERNTADDSLERFGRASLDNGETWSADMAVSDVIFPKPLQPDSAVGASRVSSYDHGAFSDDGHGNVAYHAWTDGRVAIGGQPQQDLFLDKIIFAIPSFTVTSTADHNDGACDAADCTLREAIIAANMRGGLETIQFAPGVTGTIQLGSALPTITTSMNLEGPGANLLTVRRDSGGDYRIFTIGNGTAQGPTVEISRLTIANGRLDNSSFPANSGGGLLNESGFVSLTDSAITGNFAYYGGGLCNFGGGALNLLGCTVNDNSALFNGGGIYNSNAGQGEAAVTLTNSTLSGNSADIGGAISNYAATIVSTASVSIRNSTLSGNSATSSAGGIHAQRDSASMTIVRLANTILRTGASGANLQSVGSAAIISQGHNLSNDAAGGDDSTGPDGFLNATGDIRNTNPQLDPAGLANNGGPTKTVALLSDSPAINLGDDLLAPLLDQRGLPRFGVSDIGAFEFHPPAPTPTPSSTPTPTPAPTTTLANISTRLRVETGDNVLIGGFIVTGTQPKKIIVRGIGTSLPFLDRLENPTLELHGPNGFIEANDNWVDSPNKQEIRDSTIPPSSDLEAAIVATLPANNAGYTAIVRGVNNSTGIGVVEAYDLDNSVDSKLANIATRGFVQTGDNVLIAGTIVVGQAAQKVLVRAIGPSLTVPGKLEDPILELRDANGGLVRGNDNWRTGGQEQEIINTTIPPPNDLESAVVADLPAGGASYTAIVRGVGNTTGIAVVEVYALN